MEVIIEQGRKSQTFVTIFQHLKSKISDVNIIFNEEKLYIQGLDNSQIGLFELELLKSWFKKYDVTESVTLGIKCDIFHKMLNCIEKTQEIILRFSSEGDVLNIIFISEEKGVFDKHFELPLMDIDSALMYIPSTEYSVDLKLNSPVFEKIIEQLTLFAKVADINCSEEEVSIKTTKDSSIDCGVMEVKINFEDMLEYAIEEELILALKFSLDYLHWMVQFSKLSPQTYLHFKKDTPMKQRYELDNDSFIQFFLAPQYDDF